MSTEKIQFASFWKRVLAVVIDYTIILIFMVIIGNILHLSGVKLLTTEEIVSDVQKYADKNIDKREKIQLEMEEIKKSGVSDIEVERNRRLFSSFIFSFELMYFTLLIASDKQATFGQRVLKIMVVSNREGEMSLLASFVRFLFMKISLMFYGLGFLTIPFTKESVAIHDMICNTRVVNSYFEEKEKDIK